MENNATNNIQEQKKNMILNINEKLILSHSCSSTFFSLFPIKKKNKMKIRRNKKLKMK